MDEGIRMCLGTKVNITMTRDGSIVKAMVIAKRSNSNYYDEKAIFLEPRSWQDKSNPVKYWAAK